MSVNYRNYAYLDLDYCSADTKVRAISSTEHRRRLPPFEDRWAFFFSKWPPVGVQRLTGVKIFI